VTIIIIIRLARSLSDVSLFFSIMDLLEHFVFDEQGPVVGRAKNCEDHIIDLVTLTFDRAVLA